MMIIAVVGSGGKTTLIKQLAQQYLHQGKKVFVTTSTHMYIELDTLLSDDANEIIAKLDKEHYVMAGIQSGEKITSLSKETFDAVAKQADITLVEADGSKGLPLKYPSDTEPVIPEPVDEIIIVCGLNALGHKVKDVCHRLAYVKTCLKIDDDTIMEPHHIQKLVMEGYYYPLQQQYPNAKIIIQPRHDGSLYQRVLASLLLHQQDVSLVSKDWFTPQPQLFICGGGHVAREVAKLASYLDYSITVMDERTDLVNEKRFPTADNIICDTYTNLKNYLQEDAYYVVLTPNHHADLLCVQTILKTKYQYLGMIGSKKKVASTFENLRKDGFTEAQIASIFAPIGLSIGACTPTEIAFSILSQIIQEKNKRFSSSIDHTLLNTTQSGMLCIIIDKQGSAPRGIGSMMLVSECECIGTIGGGEVEFQAINEARKLSTIAIKEFILQNANGLDMICGGKVKILFIPI